MNTEFEYMNKISSILEEVYETNKETIKVAARKFADTIKEDKMIHVFGTGHSSLLAIEMYSRAGGIGNVNPISDPDTLMSPGGERSGAMERLSGLADVIYDQYDIKRGDMMIIISNSGRNAMPVEMAMRCQKEGIYTIALTSKQISETFTSRHTSGKKLYELTDLVLDNCGKYGDACIKVGEYDTGAVSTITGAFILHTVETEATKLLVEEGFKPYIFQSQNIDGYDNSQVINKFKPRVKHL